MAKAGALRAVANRRDGRYIGLNLKLSKRLLNLASRRCLLQPPPARAGLMMGLGQMFKLEDLQVNAVVRGILPDALVAVVSVQWFGSEALELTYKDPAGRVANALLYRHDEARFEVMEHYVSFIL